MTEPGVAAMRARHANIEGDDPVAVRYGIEPHRQRMCAFDRQAWPCATVQAIDLMGAQLDERLWEALDRSMGAERRRRLAAQIMVGLRELGIVP